MIVACHSALVSASVSGSRCCPPCKGSRMKAWRVHRHGSPTEALRLDEVADPEPGPGQVRIAVCNTVLNYNDIDGCYGRYKTVNPELPYIAGEDRGNKRVFGRRSEFR